MTGLALSLLFLFLPSVLANGQGSHIWISQQATVQLPFDEQFALVSDPELAPIVANGSMFPDGGYGAGDGYGEMAHWEPFQNLYLAWIRSQYPQPWSDEARQHVGFYLGMASHGMADQVYDSLYMERARLEDAASDWQNNSMDEATEVVFSAQVGARDDPEDWLPTDVLVPLFQEAGHEVDAGTIELGHFLMHVVVTWVQQASADPEVVAEYEDQFPWATAHQLDDDAAGSPGIEAEVVALYWQELWQRLQGDAPPQHPVLTTFPPDGSLGQPTDASLTTSWFTLVFARGLEASTVSVQAFEVVDGLGHAVEVDPWLFYGQSSHVVHLRPVQDWAADEDFTVTVLPGLTTIDGFVLDEPLVFGFSTRAPVEDTGDEEEGGCVCGAGRSEGGLMGLLLSGLLCLVRRRRRR